MNYIGDKPSSRVLRPPGGGSSNIIFGGTDEAPASGNNSKPKPTYQSSVFNTTPEPVQQRSTSRQGSSSNIFGTDSDNNNTPVAPKKISNTQQSSIFAEPEPTGQNEKKVPVSRRNPITGALLDENEGKEQPTNGEQMEKKDGAKENMDQGDAEPHLGPGKKFSGIRTAQPPGGKSSITFG